MISCFSLRVSTLFSQKLNRDTLLAKEQLSLRCKNHTRTSKRRRIRPRRDHFLRKLRRQSGQPTRRHFSTISRLSTANWRRSRDRLRPRINQTAALNAGFRAYGLASKRSQSSSACLTVLFQRQNSGRKRRIRLNHQCKRNREMFAKRWRATLVSRFQFMVDLCLIQWDSTFPPRDLPRAAKNLLTQDPKKCTMQESMDKAVSIGFRK